MKAKLALIGLLVLGGCDTAAQQVAADQQDDARCVSYGAAQGTQQYTDCRMQIASARYQERQIRLERIAAMGQAMRNAGAAMQPAYAPAPLAAPITTNCMKVGTMVSCTTQ